MTLAIEHLEFTDLFSYPVLSLDMTDRGLILLEGSNGAGKSSIFAGIYWTLYGKRIKDQRADGVIRKYQGSPVVGKTRGYVRLRRGEQVVEVTRHRQHREFANKVHLKVNSHDITGSTDRHTQLRIDELLGVNALTFCHAIMFPQRGQGFASLSDAEQKRVLDELLDMDRFTHAKDRARDKAVAIQRDVDAERVLLNALDEDIKQSIERLEQLRTQQEEFAASRRAEVAKYRFKITELERARPEPPDPTILEEINKLTERVASVKDLEANLREQEKIRESCLRDTTSLDLQIERFEKVAAGTGIAPPPNPDMTVPECRDLVTQAAADLRLVTHQIEQIDASLTAADAQISRRAATTHCHTCGQELTEGARDRMFGTVVGNRDELVTRKTALSQRQQELARQYHYLVETQQPVCEAYNGWLAAETERAGAVGRLEELRPKLMAIQSLLRDADERATRMRDSLQDARQAATLVSDLQRTRERQEASQRLWERDMAHTRSLVDAAEQKLCPYTPLVAREITSREGYGEERHVTAELLERDEKILRLHQWWVEGFGNRGCKTWLIERVIPYLNSRIAEYLAVLSGGLARAELCTTRTLQDGTVKDEMHVEASYQGGGSEHGDLSGGEEARLDIAIMFALGDLGAARAGTPVQLRLLDEPFDGLDTLGKEQVVTLLEDVIVPRSRTVLVMSHDDSLKALFPQRWGVVKADGQSSIEIG